MNTRQKVMTRTSAGAELPYPEYLMHRSVEERAARGHTVREEVPLDWHERCSLPPQRADPIEILERQAATRIPELIPIRYGRMALSRFAFFRGAAAVMAGDLACTPTSRLRAQLCGDAHLLNFGFFETPERILIFDLNDFDETLRGPFEWDIKRLAASVEVAGRDLGFKPNQRRSAVLGTVRAYRMALLDFARQRHLDVWHARLSGQELRHRLARSADRATRHELRRRLRQSMRHDHLHAFSRLVERSDPGIRFVAQPPLLTPVENLLVGEQRERYLSVVRSFLRQYRESLPPHYRALLESYRYMHMARKVVGVGSVGTRDWVVLMTGRDHDDPLLLQLKEAQDSVLAPYAGKPSCESQGQRVVEGQRLTQAAGDGMLGWYRIEDWDVQRHDFYVRQLWDGKASIDVHRLTPKGLRLYGQSCGWTLARAHARSGERIAMAAYLGSDDTFDEAVTAFSSAYADTNDEDYRRLLAAIEDGRVTAADGV